MTENYGGISYGVAIIILIGCVLLLALTNGENIDELENIVFSLNECESGSNNYHWVEMEVHQDLDIKCWDIKNETFYKLSLVENTTVVESRLMKVYNFTRCPLDKIKQICKKNKEE